MNLPQNEVPSFEVSELDLFNFDEFCEVKYKDPLVQEFGFFKIYLNKDARRDSTLQDFFQMFNGEAYCAIKETVVLRNPVNCGLYGHHSLPVTDVTRQRFMEEASPDVFCIDKENLNCCMESFENGGVDALLEHFFSDLEAKALSILGKDQKKQSIKSISSRIPKWKAAYEKRQQFQKALTPEEKARFCRLSMELEKFPESHEKTCNCNLCAYLDFSIPPHPDAPIGCLYSSGIDENYDKYMKLTQNFAMVFLCHKNMLSMLDSTYNGVSFPNLYLGIKNSVFPLHVEDLSLWSFNFLMFGFPKFWIVVPPHSVSKLSDALAKCGFGGIHKSCRNSLGHKFFIPTVHWLLSEAIPFNVVIQQEGEGVVLLPNAAHSGGNLGHNLAEACNFATKSWIPYGCVYPACSCLDDAVHVDLAPIIAVHNRSLLKAYLYNNIMNAVEDDYFLKSVVHPKRLQSEVSFSAAPSSCDKKTAPQLICPICPWKWSASIPKKNVLNHLQRHHSKRILEDHVVKFLGDNFPKKKK